MNIKIVSRSTFWMLARVVGVREAAEVAASQGIALAVVQIWVKRPFA